jgi:hypothetical protein
LREIALGFPIFSKNSISEHHVSLSSDSLEACNHRQKESKDADSLLEEKVFFVLDLVKMALKQDPESPKPHFAVRIW